MFGFFRSLGNGGAVSFQDLLKCRSADGLGEKEIHAGIETFFDIAFLGEGGQSYNRRRVAHAPDKPSTLESIKVRHLDGMSPQSSQGLSPTNLLARP